MAIRSRNPLVLLLELVCWLLLLPILIPFWMLTAPGKSSSPRKPIRKRYRRID